MGTFNYSKYLEAMQSQNPNISSQTSLVNELHPSTPQINNDLSYNGEEISNSCNDNGKNAIHVHEFTDEGLNKIRELLRKTRIQNQLFDDEIDELVNDSEYLKRGSNSSTPLIDSERQFHDKIEIYHYFLKQMGKDYLERNRRNSGLWTWLALKYNSVFIKKGKINKVSFGSDCKWIYKSDIYREARQHFIAGPVYLCMDLEKCSANVKKMLLAGDIREFGGMVDAVTYKKEGTQVPALLEVAAKLYFDPKTEKMRTGATSQDKPGTIRQLIRVVAQFSQTMDFDGVEDAEKLWRILPTQFDIFKKKTTVIL